MLRNNRREFVIPLSTKTAKMKKLTDVAFTT